MDVGQAVRVINGPVEWYDRVTFNSVDPMLIGCQGRIVSYAMNDYMEEGWKVRLTDGRMQFFYEVELERLEEIEGPSAVTLTNEVEGTRTRITQEEIDALPRPEWWEDADAIRFMLFQVDVEGKSFFELFFPFFISEDQVNEHLKNLTRGEHEQY